MIKLLKPENILEISGRQFELEYSNDKFKLFCAHEE